MVEELLLFTINPNMEKYHSLPHVFSRIYHRTKTICPDFKTISVNLPRRGFGKVTLGSKQANCSIHLEALLLPEDKYAPDQYLEHYLHIERIGNKGKVGSYSEGYICDISLEKRGLVSEIEQLKKHPLFFFLPDTYEQVREKIDLVNKIESLEKEVAALDEQISKEDNIRSLVSLLVDYKIIVTSDTKFVYEHLLKYFIDGVAQLEYRGYVLCKPQPNGETVRFYKEGKTVEIPFSVVCMQTFSLYFNEAREEDREGARLDFIEAKQNLEMYRNVCIENEQTVIDTWKSNDFFPSEMWELLRKQEKLEVEYYVCELVVDAYEAIFKNNP